MICKRCGSQMFDNAKSCPFCGAVTGAENETNQNQNLIPDLESLSASPIAPPAAPPQSASPVQPPSGVSGAVPKNPFADDPVPKNPFADDPIPKNPFADDPVPKNPFADDPIPKNPFAQNPPQQNPLPPLGGAGGSSQGFAPLPPISDVRDRGEGVLGRIPMHLAGKILICIAILCFCLPFVTVSCSMEEWGSDQVLATYTGFDLMGGDLEYEDPAKKMNDSLNNSFGAGFFDDFADDEADDGEAGDDGAFSYENIMGGDEMLSLFGNVQREQNAEVQADASAEAAAQAEQFKKKNYFLIAALICGIIAFILLFIKDKKLEIVSMLFSVFAAMLTLISSFSFFSFYKITLNENMAKDIVVKTRYGVYLTAFFFMLAALAALKAQIDSNSSSGDY